MAPEIRCREVGKLLQTMPKGSGEKIFSRISQHLSECEPCREIHASFTKVESALVARKRQLDDIASRTAIQRAGVPSKTARSTVARKAWLFRPAWASVAAFLAMVAAGSTLFLTTRQPPRQGDSHMSARLTPERPAPIVSSQTIKELAEVVCRHEVALSELPYAPEAVAHEPLFPSSVQKYIEPAGTLRAIAESTIKLTRRHET